MLQNHCVLGPIKSKDLLEFMMELKIYFYLVLKNLLLFTIGLKFKKSGITYVISHNYARIKFDLYDSLPLGITLTLHNVIILIKSILNRYQNH